MKIILILNFIMHFPKCFLSIIYKTGGSGTVLRQLRMSTQKTINAPYFQVLSCIATRWNLTNHLVILEGYVCIHIKKDRGYVMKYNTHKSYGALPVIICNSPFWVKVKTVNTLLNIDIKRRNSRWLFNHRGNNQQIYLIPPHIYCCLQSHTCSEGVSSCTVS